MPISLTLEDAITKAMRTKGIRKRMKLIQDKYRIDSKELYQIFYLEALEKKWLDKCKCEYDGGLFKFVMQSVFNKCNNLLRNERKKKARATDSYDVLTEVYDDFVPDELKFDYSDSIVNLLSIEQCANRSSLSKEEVMLVLQGFNAVEIANKLGVLVNPLRERLRQFKNILVEEDLSLDFY